MSFGIFAALLAPILASAKDVVSKQVSNDVHPFVSSLASFLYAIPFYMVMLLILWLCGLETFAWQSGFWFYVFIRALTDTGAEAGRMMALERGELSTVGAIISLHPVITLFLSPLITGDPLNTSIISGVLLATIGTYFFSKVPTGIDKRTVIISLVTAVFFSLNNCFDRLSVLSASAVFSGFAMNTLAGLLTLPLALVYVGWRQSGKELCHSWKPFLTRGFFEATFMAVKLIAMSYLQAPVVSALLRLTLVFQVFAGKAFFNEQGLIYRMIGSILIVVGSILSLRS